MALDYVTINGINFQPTKISRGEVRIGESVDQLRAVDGTGRIFHRAFKQTWEFEWNGVTEAVRNQIRGVWRTTTAMSYRHVDNVLYTVVSTAFKDDVDAALQRSSGVYYYIVTLTLQEV
jgi:hypothetical protein